MLAKLKVNDSSWQLETTNQQLSTFNLILDANIIAMREIVGKGFLTECYGNIVL